MYQIARQLDNLFPLYGNFNTFTKRRKKMKKLSQFLEVHILEMPGAIYLKLESGVLMLEGISVAKIVRFRRNSMKLRIRENHIIVFLVYILMGVARQLLGPHNTLPFVLIA